MEAQEKLVSYERLKLFWSQLKKYIEKRGGSVGIFYRIVRDNTLYLDNAKILDKETISVSSAEYDESTETIIIK